MLRYNNEILLELVPAVAVTPNIWWQQSEEPIRRIVRPVRLDETQAPFVAAIALTPSIYWMAADDPARRQTRPARLENFVEPIYFSTGVHHKWVDDTSAPRIVRIVRLDATAEPVFFSLGIHHRWLDESPQRPLVRTRAQIGDATSWVPFVSSASTQPSSGWLLDETNIARRKYALRLDEITVPLGEALPPIPVAPSWFMQSEQPQAPKARWIANVGPCHWTVVFPVYPTSIPSVPVDFVPGQRMIGWY